MVWQKWLNIRSITGTHIFLSKFNPSTKLTGNITESGAKNNAALALCKNETISFVFCVDIPFCSAVLKEN